MQSIFGEIEDYRHDILGPKEIERLPYYERIMGLVPQLQTDFPRFPNGCCNEAAMRIDDLGIFGLVATAGYYRPTTIDGETLEIEHAWCIDSRRYLFVDLTQRAYSSELPLLVVMPVVFDILHPDPLRLMNISFWMRVQREHRDCVK